MNFSDRFRDCTLVRLRLTKDVFTIFLGSEVIGKEIPSPLFSFLYTVYIYSHAVILIHLGSSCLDIQFM